jgi:hypothetical protein
MLSIHLRKSKSLGQDPSSVAFLPFIVTIYNGTYKMLSKHIIKMIGILPRKISSFLQSIQDDIPLKTMGIYCIPSKCGKVHRRLTVLLKPTITNTNTITISYMVTQLSHQWPNTKST